MERHRPHPHLQATMAEGGFLDLASIEEHCFVCMTSFSLQKRCCILQAALSRAAVCQSRAKES